MSRVEDDREAARLAEKIALQRREAEAKSKEKREADSTFSKLVTKQKTEQQQKSDASLARSAIAHLLEGEKAEGSDVDKALAEGAAREEGESERRDLGDARARAGLRGFKERIDSGSRGENERVEKAHAGDESEAGMAAAGREGDVRAGESSAAGRRSDSRSGRDALEGKKAEGDAAAAAKGGAARGKGELKTGQDKGGGGQGQGGSKDDKGGQMPAGFRFNPALMAPVPVAQAKPASGSERLRRIASEIAQKIVERVRVGTNAAGKAEFQIDLRSDVLKGLSIKVSSGKGGKISAVFSGSDKDVLKALQEQSDALKQALSSRGLSLEDLKIEEKA